MINDLLSELKSGYEQAIVALRRDAAKIRTGRANPNILDSLRVDYYGTPTPVMQIAAVKVADARMITIQPWEKNMINAIEKAIMSSDLGLNPSNDGSLIRLPVPALTGERRKEFTKQVKDMGEKSKIAIRNQRRDMNDMLKSIQKDGDITEDELKKALTKVQELTDEFSKKIDEVVAEKEKEIME
ncbi:MAG: ribosome recycling factor [Proteobacteria bacterium]|jgi:ribosome recycling factor|nr:ribosome recycling factor [Pseudomonadota bacterium]